MRQPVRTALAVFLLVSLAGAPSVTGATTYEDSVEDCAYPELFDLIIMRPLSFSALVMGTMLWIPLGAWALMTARDDVDKVAGALIFNPARFTFNRPLGACGTSLTYP